MRLVKIVEARAGHELFGIMGLSPFDVPAV